MFHRAEQMLVWSLCCSVWQSSAVDIRADAEVIVENGATGILNCSFTSSEEVSSATAVRWRFQSNQPDAMFSKDPDVILLYRNRKSFPGLSKFKDRLRFIGNIDKRDVSIQLSPVQLNDSGSYYCGVTNPPDGYGERARTELRVVRQNEPSMNPPPTGESTLTLVLVSVCVVIIIIIIISATVLTIYCRRCSREDGATGGRGGGGGRRGRGGREEGGGGRGGREEGGGGRGGREGGGREEEGEGGGGGGGGEEEEEGGGGGGRGEGGGRGGRGRSPNTERVYENIRPESERIYQDLRLEEMEPPYSDLQRRWTDSSPS